MRLLGSKKGFGLLEMMISASVLAISVVATTSYLGNISEEEAKVRQRDIASNIYDEIRKAIQNPDTLAKSMDIPINSSNLILKACVDPTLPCPRRATNSNHSSGQLSINIYDESRTKIAGTESDPQGYNWEGARCNQGEAKCVWGAVGYFWATCPLKPAGTQARATCQAPVTINTRFQLRPFTSQGRKGTGSKLFEFPRDREFDRPPKTSFAVATRANEIIPKVADTCKNDQVQTGTDTAGKPICKCVVQGTDNRGRLRYDGFGRPICGEQKCQGNFEVMTGYDSNTGRITCVDVRTCPDGRNCPCKDVDLTINGDCGTGYWMVKIEYGECKAITAKAGKGTGPDNVECSKHTGKCCKLDLN